MRINNGEDVIKYMKIVADKMRYSCDKLPDDYWPGRAAIEDFGQNIINVDEEFKIGDIVRVRGSSMNPRMVVSQVYIDECAAVYCYWFNNNQDIQHRCFIIDVLEKL